MIVQKQVSVAELRKGMYVSRLDCPWTETPFLFQGFHITQAREIEILQDYCQHVYIDHSRTREIEFDTDAQPDPELVAPLPKPAEHYVERVAAAEELPAARQALEQVSETLAEVMENLREGKSVNVPNAGRAVENLVVSMVRNPDAMMLLQQLRSRDEYAYSHSLGSSVLAIAFARHLGFSQRQIKFFATGALLLDVGKLRVPDKLLKRPGRLTEEEFAEVKRHVEYGLELLAKSQGISTIALDVVANHHERFDGSGYPRGLRGRHIPVHARMAGIVDTYDAITSDRPYAAAVSPHEAIRRLYDLGETDFQKELVEQFIQCIGAYPTGTLVELTGGEVGLVVAQNRVRRLRPKVMLILGPDKIALDDPSNIDLMEQTSAEDGRPLDIVKAHPPGAFGINPQDYYL